MVSGARSHWRYLRASRGQGGCIWSRCMKAELTGGNYRLVEGRVVDCQRRRRLRLRLSLGLEGRMLVRLGMTLH
jgi:hypothetical protein